MPLYNDSISKVNSIDLHFIQYENEHPKLLLLHGLTANAFAFNGLIEAGLTKHFSVISVDQRGRGLSSKSLASFSIEDHALDILELLDFLDIKTIMVCGHSFGGLLATYLAFHYPKRFSKITILDAAPQMNPNTPKMLGSTLSRLGQSYESFDVFLSKVKDAPYITFWDSAMEAYYNADVEETEDGGVRSRSSIADIILISKAVASEKWEECFSEMNQPSLLIVAIDNYTMDQPLLPVEQAKTILNKMKACTYVEVSGNHQTMLYGKGAVQIVDAIVSFANG